MRKKIKYGLGQQDFATMRERGFLYVDKTEYIIKLIEGSDYYFLSRPRRFGKSLFLSTLRYFFEGRRDLFKGLAIDSWNDWSWETFPVVRVNLSEGSYSRPDGLYRRLLEVIKESEDKFGVESNEDDPRARFRNLLVSLYKKTGKGVVVLVDEYEKPLLDSIEEPHHSNFVKQLSEFYSVLKGNEEMIRFLFITGVTRFGHLNIFSGLNNLIDISLDNEYSDICGITEEELKFNFQQGIENLSLANGYNYEDALTELKLYYDGYHFSRVLVDIYNPFSLLSCLRVSDFVSRLFQSGSSNYLIKKLRSSRFDIENLENITASENDLLGVNATMDNIITLLYQSGYLTIKNYERKRRVFNLGLPNREVSEALYSAIIPYYLGERYRESRNRAMNFTELLEKGKIREAMEWLKGYFSSIPYDAKLDYESEFQQVIYAFFALTGLIANATLEKQTSDGRIDLVLELTHYVYLFEFKLGTDAKKALNQINTKEYDLQWRTGKRKIIKVGVAFSQKSRGIADFIFTE